MTPFSTRTPSTNWEQLPLAGLPGTVWCWFKPAQGPLDVYVQVPPETLQATGGALTVRRLIATSGLSEAEVQGWAINGAFIPHTLQTAGYLDQPLPWLSAPLILRTTGMAVPPLAPVSTLPQTTVAPQPAVSSSSPDSESVFQRIETDWNTVLQIETNMAQMRKQLHAMSGKLKSLNRDLNMEENNAADSQDKRDWQDIRRWLRDAASGVSRAIREFDVGDLSAAGGRGRFDDLYREYVALRKPLPNLAQVAAEFEMYRKLIQNQFQKMQTASVSSARDGEQRAAQFLTRLAAKIRVARGKR